MSQAVRASLKHGYRLYDTGAHYGNERELGDAFKQYLPEQSLQRDDINIISKLGLFPFYILTFFNLFIFTCLFLE